MEDQYSHFIKPYPLLFPEQVEPGYQHQVTCFPYNPLETPPFGDGNQGLFGGAETSSIVQELCNFSAQDLDLSSSSLGPGVPHDRGGLNVVDAVLPVRAEPNMEWMSNVVSAEYVFSFVWEEYLIESFQPGNFRCIFQDAKDGMKPCNYVFYCTLEEAYGAGIKNTSIKGYTTYSKLIEHILNHLQPFQCTQCSARFGKVCNLTRHSTKRINTCRPPAITVKRLGTAFQARCAALAKLCEDRKLTNSRELVQRCMQAYAIMKEAEALMMMPEHQDLNYSLRRMKQSAKCG